MKKISDGFPSGIALQMEKIYHTINNKVVSLPFGYELFLILTNGIIILDTCAGCA